MKIFFQYVSASLGMNSQLKEFLRTSLSNIDIPITRYFCDLKNVIGTDWFVMNNSTKNDVRGFISDLLNVKKSKISVLVLGDLIEIIEFSFENIERMKKKVVNLDRNIFRVHFCYVHQLD